MIHEQQHAQPGTRARPNLSNTTCARAPMRTNPWRAALSCKGDGAQAAGGSNCSMPNAALAAPIDQLDRVPRKTPLSPPRESALTQCCGLTTEFSPSKREVGAPPGNRSSGGTISGATFANTPCAAPLRAHVTYEHVRTLPLLHCNPHCVFPTITSQ